MTILYIKSADISMGISAKLKPGSCNFPGFNFVVIKMTDDPANEDFEYMAHRRGDTQKDMFYIGAYLGSEISSKLRSLSGKTVAGSKTHSQFETLAKANGAPTGNGTSGYNQFGWYQLIFLQCMYVLKYKNLNSQQVIGIGVNNTSGHSATGGTETWGMDKKNGTASGNNEHMKLFGIEDLYGNGWSCIGGFWYSSDRHIWTATENFNDNGSGYTDRGASGATNTLGWSWSTKVIGTTHGGFITLSTSGGSDTTYYCDHCQLEPSRLLHLGITWSANTETGIFELNVDREGTDNSSYFMSRLMYV